MTSDPGGPIREVYPYLCVRGAVAAVEFYTRVFGAVETLRLNSPDGRIAHCELRLGPSTLMLADEFPEYGVRSRRPSAARARPFTCTSTTSILSRVERWMRAPSC